MVSEKKGGGSTGLNHYPGREWEGWTVLLTSHGNVRWVKSNLREVRH